MENTNYRTLLVCAAALALAASTPGTIRASASGDDLSMEDWKRLPAFGSTAKPVRAVNLLTELKSGAAKLAPGVYRLSPEWVGTMRDVAWTSKWKDEAEPPEPFRLNFLVVDADGGCALVAAPTDAGAMRWADDGYSRIDSVTTAEILSLKTFADFERVLGPKKTRLQRFRCGTSDLNDLRAKRYWTSRSVFSLNSDGTLTLRSVTARFQLKSSDGEIPLRDNVTTAEDIFVHEGAFSPAKQDSAEELRLFPSEDEKAARIHARLMAELEKQPEPLRAFLRAKVAGEKPFRLAVEKAKASPEPELFRQMMARTRDFFDVVVAIKDLSPIGDWRPEPEFHASQIRVGWHEFLPLPGDKPLTPLTAERLKLLRSIIMALPEAPVEEDRFAPVMAEPPGGDGKPRLMSSKARSAGSLAEMILEGAGITDFLVDEPTVRFSYKRNGNSYSSEGFSHLPGDESRALTLLRDRLLQELDKKAKSLESALK